MIPDIERTIVALASGAWPAPRAIVRLTGPKTRTVLARLLDIPSETGLLAAEHLTSATATCHLAEIDRNLPLRVLYWPDARSYTGQPSAELHLVGSLPLAEALIAACCRFGAEPAERGEFTLRAFLAGKLDLAQAEAVLGVIEADGPDALKAALEQLGGNLAPAVQPLRMTIVDILAELEAGLDFVDEDIEFITRDSVVDQLQHVHAALTHFASRLRTRSSTDIAPRAALVGLPNSGKSTLFNALCGASLAIVSQTPGTTRDYLQQRIGVDGVVVDLIDTAGWEELHGGSPRALAQQQLRACLDTADVCLLCVDCSADDSTDDFSLNAFVQAIEHVERPGMPWLIVGTKMDVPDADLSPCVALAERFAERIELAGQPLGVSSATARGLEALRTAMAAALDRSTSVDPLTVVHHTAVRCRAAVAGALRGVEEAIAVAQHDGGEELIAAELRLVLDELATIIGEVHSDDILGEIFSRFCIGK